MNINIRQQSYMVGLGVWKTRGQQNKRGDPPIFFRTPPRGGVRKKSGVRKERGVHAPRAPPLSTLVPAPIHLIPESEIFLL